jgi:hypothetical protein
MDLNQLRRKKDYLEHDAPQWVRVIFPRVRSLDWFIKHRREWLREREAIVLLGKEYFVLLGAFEQAVRDYYNLTDRPGHRADRLHCDQQAA